MEYANGRVPKSDDIPTLMPKLLRLMTHMANIIGHDYGSLGGGFSHGILWEKADIKFRDIHDMEIY